MKAMYKNLQNVENSLANLNKETKGKLREKNFSIYLNTSETIAVGLAASESGDAVGIRYWEPESIKQIIESAVANKAAK